MTMWKKNAQGRTSPAYKRFEGRNEKKAASRLDFEEAANIRDKILILEGVSK